MNYDEIYEQVEALREQIVSSTTPVQPQDVGLAARCGPVLVGENFIATLMPRLLDYYGGFEYVTAGVMTIGAVKVYLNEDARVQRILDICSKENENE